jgi:hypothetical protein
MTTAHDLLQHGIEALKAGRKAEARTLLMQVVQRDQYNELAWLWLSGAVETDDERRTCLENVLAINPHNSVAEQGLDSLKVRQGIRPLIVTPPPTPSPQRPSTESVPSTAQQKESVKSGEVTYYSDDHITITNARARIYGKTYAMAHVTSVAMLRQNPDRLLPVVMLILGGGVFVVTILVIMLLGTDWSSFACFWLPSFVCMVIGGIWLLSSRPKYILRISTASGETDATASRDRDYIGRVVQVINQVIIERG